MGASFAGFSVVLALAAGSADECVLPRAVKVFNDGVWSSIPATTRVTVKARTKQWITLESDKGNGRASSPVFDALCPPPVAPAAIAAVEAPVAVEPPVPVPVPVPVPATATPESPPPPAIAPAAALIESPSAPPAERLVAVSALRAGPGTGSSASALTTVLAAELGAARGYRAVAPNELQALLAHQADASLLGCESVNCLANIAKLADAELLATGTLDVVEGAFVLSLSLIEPAGPSVVARQEAVWRGGADEMLALVRPLVARLLAGADAVTHKGTLEVLAPEGALVIVDGKDVGHAPLPAPVADLSTGAHTVQVSLDGHLPAAQDVVVAHNEVTVARVSLEEVPLLQRPWFWVAAGGAALVAGGTAAGLTAWAVLSQDTASSVVLAPKP